MSHRKEIKELMRRMEDAGAECVGYSKNHPRMKMPDGSTISLPSSPSDWRGLKNAASLARRRGLDISVTG